MKKLILVFATTITTFYGNAQPWEAGLRAGVSYSAWLPHQNPIDYAYGYNATNGLHLDKTAYLRLTARKYAFEISYSPFKGSNNALSNYLTDFNESWPPNTVYSRMQINSSSIFHQFNLQAQRRITRLFKKHLELWGGIDGNFIFSSQNVEWGFKYYDKNKALIAENIRTNKENDIPARLGISEQARYSISKKYSITASFIEVINLADHSSLAVTYPTLGFYANLGLGYKF